MSPRPREHGTRLGHDQHLRAGDEVCEPCRAANAAYHRSWNAQARVTGARVHRGGRAGCGTEAGYKAHRRHGEQPCVRCVDARNERRRELADEKRRAVVA